MSAPGRCWQAHPVIAASRQQGCLCLRNRAHLSPGSIFAVLCSESVDINSVSKNAGIAVTLQWSVHYITAARVCWCKCYFCVRWGSLPPIHRQFVRPAVEAPTEACGTAGAPPWLIKVVARTSSPPRMKTKTPQWRASVLCLPVVKRAAQTCAGPQLGKPGSGPKLIIILWQKASFVGIL